LNVLKTAGEDTAKVNILNALANALAGINPDTTVSLSTEALDLATKVNFKLGIAEAHSTMGMGLFYLGRYKEALKNYEDAIKGYNEMSVSANPSIKSKILLGKGWAIMRLGLIHNNQGNYTEGFRNYLCSIENIPGING